MLGILLALGSVDIYPLVLYDSVVDSEQHVISLLCSFRIAKLQNPG